MVQSRTHFYRYFLWLLPFETEHLHYLVMGYTRDVMQVAVYGVEDSFADLIAHHVIGDKKGDGWAAKGYGSEINSLLMSVWGYPVVLNHEVVAAELERVQEDPDIANKYRRQIAKLRGMLGEQPSPKEVPTW